MKTLKTTFTILCLALGSAGQLYAQLNVGSTTAPPSTLNVQGSFGANYLNSSDTVATLGTNNFYYSYNGATPGTVHLPAAVAGAGNFGGRMYYIKNSGTSTLTVQASGSELIDNQSGSDVSSVLVPKGYAAMLISTGATSGSTWEVALLASTKRPSNIALVENYIGTTPATVNAGTTADVPGMLSSTIISPLDRSQIASITVTGYAILSGNSNDGKSAQGVFALMQSVNGGPYTKISSGFASTGDGGALSNLPSPITFTTMTDLIPGATYNFKIQYSAWNNTQKINPILTSYLGYDNDDEAMATRMSIVVYNN